MLDTATPRRRSAVLPIRRRPTDEDKKIFLIGTPLRHITGARRGEVQRYPIGDPALDRHEHYQCRVLISCKMGVVEWTPIIFYCKPTWYSISGIDRLSHYAAEPLQRALLNAVRDFTRTEGRAAA